MSPSLLGILSSKLVWHFDSLPIMPIVPTASKLKSASSTLPRASKVQGRPFTRFPREPGRGP
ncbi:uncharacterized protein PADG_11381 [Paracoccidioides brasiliensis Pb18]|uniref:Uncharacterized protein n=1 Tax=Paracoccidioides brasiliensis (strain Pb18) TaxID=502780 RepID=A0A0A0HVD4_PARBD|nr:uncharacterized protein PADG_11381 [Paracoccidioides brasiliensis Pb18]KGM92552.1 hypothetical protein PADG_11381 [Paracoccidioides brasiliensis Pb18]